MHRAVQEVLLLQSTGSNSHRLVTCNYKFTLFTTFVYFRQPFDKLLISKRPLNITNSNKKINYRQSSLDIDNRSSACKSLMDNNNSSLLSSNYNANLGNKSYLSVPKLQSTPRNRMGSAKQLFKQIALDEDEQSNESSLLLPLSTPTPIPIPITTIATTLIPTHLQMPSVSGVNLSTSSKSINDPQISIISSSSSSTHSNQSTNPQSKNMHTLVVDDENDGNLKKSESCEVLRILTERRKV